MTIFLYELSHHQPNLLKSDFFITGAAKSPPFTTDVDFPQLVTNNVAVVGIQHFQTSSFILLLCDLVKMLKGGGLLCPSLSYNPSPMSLLSRGLPPSLFLFILPMLLIATETVPTNLLKMSFPFFRIHSKWNGSLRIYSIPQAIMFLAQYISGLSAEQT